MWHSLTEDGKVEIVKIKFGNKIYDNVNVKHLNPIDEGSHSHPKREKDDDKKKKKTESKMSLKLEELVGKKLTEEQFDEAAGKKDACYHKVKARYDVWPSAYASGALVKCRKVGAKNWGNKSKKKESVNEKRGTCWVGYQQGGMKKKGGKMVPNCVKEITEIYYEENGKGHGYTFEYINDGKLNDVGAEMSNGDLTRTWTLEFTTAEDYEDFIAESIQVTYWNDLITHNTANSISHSLEANDI